MTQYRQLIELHGTKLVDMKPQKKGKVGRKSKLNHLLKRSIITKNSMTEGMLPIRNLAEEVQIPKSSLQRYLITMKSIRKAIWIRPKLSESHKIERMRWILGLRSGPRSWTFSSQMNVIVIDESWFYLHRVKNYVRLFPDDEIPEPPRVQHKSHIPKIMFLTALARPQREHRFNGKIGIWRVEEERICQRSNRYHQRGDIYTQDCTMNSALYREFMMKIFNAIKIKMPWLRGQPVFVQQDGASPHKGNGNIEYFNTEGRKDGWNITVITQPAQSPDLNINDLAFFRSLKCHVEMIKKGANSLDILYDSVLEAWDNYNVDTLEHIWSHQYECYRKILHDKGSNSYDPPHSDVRKRGGIPDLQIIREDFVGARDMGEAFDAR